MGDKALEDLKKKVAAEVKELGKKVTKAGDEAKPLWDEEEELEKKKELTDKDKTRKVDLRKALQNLEQKTVSDADATSERIARALKANVPNDQKAIPEYQKGMEKWYRDAIEKEPGLNLGDGLKLSGELSIKDKKANIFLNGKF